MEQDSSKLHEQIRPLMEHSMYPKACSFAQFLTYSQDKNICLMQASSDPLFLLCTLVSIDCEDYR